MKQFPISKLVPAKVRLHNGWTPATVAEASRRWVARRVGSAACAVREEVGAAAGGRLCTSMALRGFKKNFFTSGRVGPALAPPMSLHVGACV